MFNYAIVQISGRQYKVIPGKDLLVDFLGTDAKTLECDVLMTVNNGDVQIGTPFLKDKVVFDIVETVRGKKIRVATYHAKANTRKVKGSRAYKSKIRLQEKGAKVAKAEKVETSTEVKAEKTARKPREKKA